MSKGDIVHSPEGERIELVDIGQEVLLDDDLVRVWNVALRPGEVQPWHLHHNPYVVLSLEASPGRMDWLDGSEPRHLDEYVGGAVYRPTSPVHRLTNIGRTHYRNRLIEFKHLGELRSAPYDVGPGARSVEGQRPGPTTADGRLPVLEHEHVRIWVAPVAAGEQVELALSQLPHVIARIAAPALAADPTGAVATHPGGSFVLDNDDEIAHQWFIVELSYTARLNEFAEDNA